MSSQTLQQGFPVPSRSRGDGYVLIGATVLQVLAMAHHPSVHTTDTAQAVHEIARLSSLSGWVHGSLMLLLLTAGLALLRFSARRTWAKRRIQAAVMAYAVGLFALLIAATMDGFVITQVATLAPHATEVDLQINRQLLILCSIVIQSFSALGMFAISVAILVWSLDLLLTPGATRAFAIIGIGIAAVPLAGLSLGLIHLNVQGAMMLLLIQGLWNLGIGALMIAERV